jgi:hypothetical protein
MTILEPVLAKMLSIKVVHNYHRDVLVKFENFWIPQFGVMEF